MEGKSKGVQDQRVIQLASEITTAKDTQIPRLLLQIQTILDTYAAGSIPLRNVKLDIWKYDLLHILVPTLRQDFSKIPQGWQSASKLSHILSQCCVGLSPDDSENYKNEFLPDASEQLLMLARRIQNKYCKTSDVLEDTRKELLEYMRTVLQAVTYLCGGFEFLTLYVMRSPWLLKLMMEEDVETCMVALITVQHINRTKRGVFGELEEEIVHAVLDELVYKLSAAESDALAGCSTRTILVICDSHYPTVELLCSRYRGLKTLLNKWRGKGFGSDLRKLQNLLDAGSMQRAEQQRLHRAARTVQAWWRSYATRKKIKKAGQAIATFQRSFRKRREEIEEYKQYEKERKELDLFLLKQRKKAMRGLHKKQLETLEFLPASEVSKHLSGEQTRAALKIQTIWRGHHMRRSLNAKRDSVGRVRAAIVIQRTIRRWLERVRAKKAEPPGWQRPPGLTDERRVQLQNIIMEKREGRQPVERTRAQQEELHEKVQATLKRHVTTSQPRRKQELHRQALLARLQLDAQLLLNAPPLAEASSVDLGSFTCHSVPIASKARHNHADELRLMRQPWWKKLGDAYQDSKYEEEQAQWKVF